MGRLLKTIGAQQPDTAQIEKLKEEYKSYGINYLQNPIKRNLITPSYAHTNGTDITYEKNPFKKVEFEYDSIFSKANVLTNLKFNTKIPYIDVDNIQWTNGEAEGNSTVNSEYLQPHRITTYVDVSREIMNQTDEFENKLIEQVVLKLKEKLLESIFTDEVIGYADDLTQLHGIIAGAEITDLTDYDSLVDFKYSGDINKVNNSFIISPKAAQYINKMKDGNLLKDNKLLNTDVYCINCMKDGYIIYCPLECLNIAQWSILDYTRDDYSLASDGKIRLTFQAWFDFNFVRKDLIKVGKFGNSENNGE